MMVAQYKKEIQVALIEGEGRSGSSLSPTPSPQIDICGQFENLW